MAMHLSMHIILGTVWLEYNEEEEVNGGEGDDSCVDGTDHENFARLENGPPGVPHKVYPPLRIDSKKLSYFWR